MWYKWLRFKDIVQGFGKLKKMVEKNGMVWRIEKSEKMKWNGMGEMGKPNKWLIITFVSSGALYWFLYWYW